MGYIYSSSTDCGSRELFVRNGFFQQIGTSEDIANGNKTKFLASIDIRWP
ncbi:hypothetical protein Plhal304r1_c061g0148041 [Plasmopara halstedii]